MLWIFLLASLSRCIAIKTPIPIETTYGPLMGFYDSETDLTQFRGIPYAKPPIGELRFMDPEPPEKWATPLNATEYGYICPQDTDFLKLLATDWFDGEKFELEADEDCLSLSVTVPGKVDPNAKLPVMFWIHGGGFVFGAGNLMDEYTLVKETMNVVLVTINYRLGALGFLFSTDGVVKGNMGLRDAQLALKWTKDNIGKFGGDATRVTVFGESAGADMTGNLILSPGSADLFQRAIVQSGFYGLNPFSGLSINNQHSNHIFDFVARGLECAGSSKEKLKCIKTKSADDMIKKAQASPHFIIGPTIDGRTDGIPNAPQQMLEKANFNKVDLMIGFNKYEGGLFFCLFAQEPPICQPLRDFDADQFEEAVRTLAVPMLMMSDRNITKSRDDITNAIVYEYKPRPPVTGVPLQRIFFRMVGDNNNRATSSYFARTLKENSKNQIWMYEFTERSSISQKNAELFDGPQHGDELMYSFGMVFRKGKTFTDREKQLSRDMMRIWTQFATSGNPNPVLARPGGPTWPQFDGVTRQYIKINGAMTTQSVKSNIMMKREDFWLKYLPTLAKKDDPTCECKTSGALLPQISLLLVLAVLTLPALF